MRLLSKKKKGRKGKICKEFFLLYVKSKAKEQQTRNSGEGKKFILKNGQKKIIRHFKEKLQK